MFRSFRKIKIEKDWTYRLNIYSRKSNELDRFGDEDPDGVVVGIVGSFSSVCCSATADASCRIASVSWLTASDSTLNVLSDNESTINPLNSSDIVFNSESASGMNLPSYDFKPFIVDTAGPIETIASPRS